MKGRFSFWFTDESCGIVDGCVVGEEGNGSIIWDEKSKDESRNKVEAYMSSVMYSKDITFLIFNVYN
jgi:hypothetical protein